MPYDAQELHYHISAATSTQAPVNGLPADYSSDIPESYEVDDELQISLERLSEDLSRLSNGGCLSDNVQLTDKAVRLLERNFNYLLERISCDEVVSEEFLPEETTCEEFERMCADLIDSRKRKIITPNTLMGLCNDYVRTLGPPLDLRALSSSIIESHQDICLNAMDIDTEVIRPEVQTIISDGWDRAWETQYEERGLQNFMAYLDSLWLERKAHWKWGKPTATSFCATIVQSSCAGKSRLVYSLGSYLIAPVLNLLKATWPHGMDGHPEGDEVILKFLESRREEAKIKDSDRKLEYIEQLTQVTPKNILVHPCPRRWLLCQRLTALSLIVGVFVTIDKLISRGKENMIAISEYLKLGSETRNEFLEDIVSFAKAFLKKNEMTFNEMLTRAVTEEKEEIQTRGKRKIDANAKGDAIARVLAKCGTDAIHQLFYKMYASKSLCPEKVLKSDSIRFVLVFDEAKTLIEEDFYNSFRWVFDNVLKRAWEKGQWRGKPSIYAKTQPLPFMAVFLGTNSKVADFIPPGQDASYRYFIRSTKVPRPFTALPWDVHVGKQFRLKQRVSSLRSASLRYNHLSTMDWLCRFGRPVWYARWSSVLDEARTTEKAELIHIVQEKLCHIRQGTVEDFMLAMAKYVQGVKDTQNILEDLIQASSAVLSILVGLDLDFTCPSRAAELVASRLRWAVASNDSLTRFLTTYPSEPILAEAAAGLFFGETGSGSAIYIGILNLILAEIEKGNYDFGSDGELTARILCLMARYKSLQTPEMPADGMDNLGPVLESHRLTKVTSFLRCLFRADRVTALMKRRKIWNDLDSCYINFSHFTEDLCDTQAHNSLSREGLFGAFLRGRAIQCKQGQAGIDLVVPMAVLIGSTPSTASVSPDHISAIIIQVKNRKTDSGNFTASYIHKMQFDLRHFHGLGNMFYLGIWMSFRSQTKDFQVMELSTNNWDDMPPEENSKHAKPKTITANNQPDSSRGTCLSARGRGFKEIYNPELPLDLLWSLVERAPFSSHIKDIRFTSDRERQEAMRPIWNSSSGGEISVNVESIVT